MSAMLRWGKTWGLRRLSGDEGFFRLLGADRRALLCDLIAERRGMAAGAVDFADVLTLERLLIETLGQGCTALALDPSYGLAAAPDLLSARAGLLLTLEDHRFQETPHGRLSQPIRDWSVEKTKRLGADGAKVQLWYRPDAGAEVIAHQQHCVRGVGEACARADLAFVLELRVYPLAHESAAAGNPLDVPQLKASLVRDSVRSFLEPEYGVDLLVVESPLPAGADTARAEPHEDPSLQRPFEELGALCRQAGVPWILACADLGTTQFRRALAHACQAGARGFLAGPAVWGEALQAFPDIAGCRRTLERAGLDRLEELTALARRFAAPWAPDYAACADIRAEGDFCKAYEEQPRP